MCVTVYICDILCVCLRGYRTTIIQPTTGRIGWGKFGEEPNAIWRRYFASRRSTPRITIDIYISNYAHS